VGAKALPFTIVGRAKEEAHQKSVLFQSFFSISFAFGKAV
jgi:hypothetical protein